MYIKASDQFKTIMNELTKTKYNTINFKYKHIKGLISVIIPVYKDAKGLHDTLTSLQKQTLDKSKYEVIIANDGDDSHVSEVCKEFEVKEIKITPNRGSYNARNKALEESKGEFLAFTDADVIVSNYWLEEGLESLKTYDYIGGPVNFINTNPNNLVHMYEKHFDFDIYKSFLNDHYCVTANLFVRRDVINAIGGFDVRLKSGGDMEFGQRVHFFSAFSQFYNKNNSVLHPHRNYLGILIKKKRVVRGIQDLLRYFPNRFSNNKLVLIDAILYSLIPPQEYIFNLSFFFFIWHIKLIDLYINVKYRHSNMIFFNKKSHILKLFNKIKNILSTSKKAI